jgi:hypothetical protein
MKKLLLVTLLVICIVALYAMNKNSFSEKADYTFVVAGDDRVLPTDVSPDTPSTANLYHLQRMYKEIAQLKPLPKYLFFNGDLVMGYCDTILLAKELKAWIKIFKESPLGATNIKLVVIAGNHEVDGAGKVSNAANERTFVREMKEYIRGNNGPTMGGADNFSSDQHELTYSFDFGGDHFVVFNTDPAKPGDRVPLHWMEKDIKTAHENGARHIFLFGHDPAKPPHYMIGNVAYHDEYGARRDSMWNMMGKYGCTVYFGSHFHTWDSISGKPWEIICGNGGAHLDKDWKQSYYGYTLINAYSKVDVTSIGHNIDNAKYRAATPDSLTVVKAKFTIE